MAKSPYLFLSSFNPNFLWVKRFTPCEPLWTQPFTFFSVLLVSMARSSMVSAGGSLVFILASGDAPWSSPAMATGPGCSSRGPAWATAAKPGETYCKTGWNGLYNTQLSCFMVIFGTEMMRNHRMLGYGCFRNKPRWIWRGISSVCTLRVQ